MPPIKKAMILCAGLGTRLRPITNVVPKPMVPVLNVENVLHSIRILETAGINEIIVNLHYLPNILEDFLKSHKKTKAKIHFSKETTLLGTGGGVKKVEPFFEKQPFILLNCDFVTDIDISFVIQKHFAEKSLATMLLYSDQQKEARYSKVGIDSSGKLCALPKLQTKIPVKTGIFTGIHVLESETLSLLEEKPCGINEILYPALMKDKPSRVLGVFAPGGNWCDTGEVDTFLASSFSLLDRFSETSSAFQTLSTYSQAPNRLGHQIWSSTPVSSAEVTVMGPCLIGANCTLEKGVQIGPYAVIGDGCSVGANSKIEKSVILSGTKLDAHSQVSDRIVLKSLSAA